MGDDRQSGCAPSAGVIVTTIAALMAFHAGQIVPVILFGAATLLLIYLAARQVKGHHA